MAKKTEPKSAEWPLHTFAAEFRNEGMTVRFRALPEEAERLARIIGKIVDQPLDYVQGRIAAEKTGKAAEPEAPDIGETGK